MPQVATTVVYVTAPQTFEGPVVYTTLTGGEIFPKPATAPPVQTMAPSVAPDPLAASPGFSNAPSQSPSPFPSPSPSSVPSPSPSPSPSQVQAQSDSSSPSFGSGPSSTARSNTQSNAFAMPTGATTRSSPTFSAEASPSASTSSQASQASGLGGGAKAGLAFGLILGLGAVLAVVLIVYCRKKKQNRAYGEMDEDRDMFEKSHFSHDGASFGKSVASVRTARTMSTAPRLSLRPVTQFLPNLMGDRKSVANPLAMASGPRNTSPNGQHLTVGYGASLSPADDPSNPFGNHAEPSTGDRTTTRSAMAPSLAPRSGPSPNQRVPANTPDGRELAAAMLTGAAIGAGASAASVAGSHREDAEAAKPEPLNISTSHSRSPSPPDQPSSADTEFTAMSSIPPTPVVAKGASAAAAAPQVHRVQLDFKPSMDDELALQAGQLVRLLHEYDDGWVSLITG
jgi:hypothetical protein